MRRLFQAESWTRVPDGTLVAAFLNSSDTSSGLPRDLLPEFSLAAGEIEAGVESKIHVMPFVTQVTYVLSGALTVKMKEPGPEPPYRLEVAANQAIVTRPRTLFQLCNATTASCRVLYIVGPPYLFELDARGKVVYDDALALDGDWSELEQNGWRITELERAQQLKNLRSQAEQRLRTRGDG